LLSRYICYLLAFYYNLPFPSSIQYNLITPFHANSFIRYVTIICFAFNIRICKTGNYCLQVCLICPIPNYTASVSIDFEATTTIFQMVVTKFSSVTCKPHFCFRSQLQKLHRFTDNRSEPYCYRAENNQVCNYF
jgi:hypothetical protein